MDIENGDKPSKVEEKKAQWESFVKKAKTKTGNHTTMVRFYNALYNSMILSVILISGILTCVILLGGIGKMVLAALGGSCTVLTATSKFLVADRKKAGHKRSAKLFQTLLVRMLRCETLAEYNTLWHELQEAIIREPLVLIWRRRSKKTKISYIMAPRLEQVFEGKVEEPVIPPAAQPVYRPPMNYKPNEFNPHDFHVMSMNGHPNHQSSNREDGGVGISGFHESQTTRNNNRQKSKDQFSEEKMPLMATSKTKKKKTKTDSEKSRKSSLGGNSSQGTLDDIEEQDYEEQESILGTRESLTEQRRGKQKKGQTNRDLPPPPPTIDEDEDEQEIQQTQIGRNTSTSKNFRSTLPSRNDRSIVYNEEEENELSEDTDDLDENGETSYPRN